MKILVEGINISSEQAEERKRESEDRTTEMINCEKQKQKD